MLVLADAQFSGMMQRASGKELSALKTITAKRDVITLAALKEEHPEIKSPAEVLRRLKNKGLIQRVSRGQYTIGDKLFREYLSRMSDD